MIGDYGRLQKARELEPTVTVRGAHHGDLDALVAQPGNTPCPLSFHCGLPLELEAELAKERDRRREVFDDDSDIVHPFECHAVHSKTRGWLLTAVADEFSTVTRSQ